MHPFTSDGRRLGLYLIVWAVIGLTLGGLLTLVLPLTARQALLFSMPLAFMYGAIALSAWWVCRSLPLGATEPLKLVGSLTAATLQSALGLTAAAALAAAILRATHVFPEDRWVTFQAIGIVGVAGIPLYVTSIIVHYLLLTFEASRESERRALGSQVAAREAELRALRAQLNPHFLFNSLNSINALIGPEPEGARRMCESLGDFLRKTLSLGARERVTLSEELALVERYLSIEHVRFGERLAVEYAIEPAAECCVVPPLLLQPLVENAIKHGIAERIEGGTVRLSATRRDGWLTVSVENEVDADAPSRAGEGVGLENVRRRLEALAARDGRLEATRLEGRFRVTLTLPAVEADESLGAVAAPPASTAQPASAAPSASAPPVSMRAPAGGPSGGS